ncbi:MAG: hypothetical protein EZS28_041309, partial [Streblomastix strix]
MIFIVIILQVLITYVPVFHRWFGTNDTKWYEWLIAIVIGIVVFIIAEFDKHIRSYLQNEDEKERKRIAKEEEKQFKQNEKLKDRILREKLLDKKRAEFLKKRRNDGQSGSAGIGMGDLYSDLNETGLSTGAAEEEDKTRNITSAVNSQVPSDNTQSSQQQSKITKNKKIQQQKDTKPQQQSKLKKATQIEDDLDETFEPPEGYKEPISGQSIVSMGDFNTIAIRPPVIDIDDKQLNGFKRRGVVSGSVISGKDSALRFRSGPTSYSSKWKNGQNPYQIQQQQNPYKYPVRIGFNQYVQSPSEQDPYYQQYGNNPYQY